MVWKSRKDGRKFKTRDGKKDYKEPSMKTKKVKETKWLNMQTVSPEERASTLKYLRERGYVVKAKKRPDGNYDILYKKGKTEGTGGAFTPSFGEMGMPKRKK